MVNYAKPNQKLGFVREFAITLIVITEFDCTFDFFINHIRRKKNLMVY